MMFSNENRILKRILPKLWSLFLLTSCAIYILLNDLSSAFFRMNQAIVKEGMISVKGVASSRKFKTPPINPNRPPKSLLKINAEMGAQTISENSATNGNT